MAEDFEIRPHVTRFKEAFDQSKFRNIPGFPTWTEGHVLLQEHGSAVAYRNVKIRVLPAN